MPRILALWLPNWPVQRLVRDQPELAGRAIVLYEQDARHGQRVKTCSAAAEHQAVRPGMPLAEAQTLVMRPATEGNRTGRPAARESEAVAGDPLVASYDARRDQEALVALAEWCEQFSPLVGLDQADEPDTLLLDISGLAHLFGGEQELARAVVTACRQQDLTVRVAIADTVSAAWSLARWSEVLAEDTGGATVVERLPVEALRLASRAVEQLHRLGIRRVGQLNCLPRASLAARFGESLLEQLDKLAGTVAEPIVAHHAREPLAVRWCFEQPTTHHETLEYVVGDLLSQLARRLLERGQGVLRLTCQLVCRNRPPLNIDISLFRPTTAPQHLLALAKLQLALVTLPEAVEEIRVRALTTAPREQRQGELFGESPRDQPAQLALLVERLSNRLGRERVLRAELLAEAQPELAYRYRPLAGESAASPSAAPPSPASSPAGMALPGPLLRPLRLFAPPQPIDVVGLALGGPPAMFHYQRRRHRVARCFGPERIETGWWRGESCRRDYYRVETEEGSRWWLFRRLQDQCWFLHGVFD